MKKQLVSFVIPCYRSAETIGGVVEEIDAAMASMERYEYEVILVNDCSPDDTFGKIRELCQKDKRITGVNLARNFGQHAALMAGFHQVKGDILVCLDDDGQTPANEVGKLLSALEDGADVAYAKYDHKHHSAFRNFGSRVNDRMLCFMLGKPKDLFISSYFAARRFVLDEMLRYENAFPYVIGLVLRATRNVVNVTVHHRDRQSGTSGYTFGKLLALWFNGFTAFSEKPLRIATLVGVFCAMAGFLYGIYTVIKKLVLPGVPIGFSALMSSIMFIGGMLMLMLGLIGEYVGRMYICINNAPQFVIREVVGGDEDEKRRRRAKRMNGECFKEPERIWTVAREQALYLSDFAAGGAASWTILGNVDITAVSTWLVPLAAACILTPVLALIFSWAGNRGMRNRKSRGRNQIRRNAECIRIVGWWRTTELFNAATFACLALFACWVSGVFWQFIRGFLHTMPRRSLMK